jgi:aspartyl-tRNA(Asn)/glutamyl-tRNA(Gln) amidotransferase subunit A
MMTDLTNLTMTGALAGLAKGEFTSVELTEAHVRAVEASRALNAFITETPDQAIAMAERADAQRAKGEAGPMNGLPIAVKDLFCTAGFQTTAGSHILEGFKPPYESTVTANLWRDGAVMLGKVNLDEFAMGSSNVTSYFGPVISPWSPGVLVQRDAAETDAGFLAEVTAAIRQPRPVQEWQWSRKLVPGGSSGGSAAAVAARCAMAATGTDTGGSIRQPASFVGIVGIKPTYGRVSRFGMIAFASSLDQGGPMAQTAEDCGLLLNAMAGFDPRDSTSLERDKEDFTRDLNNSLQGLKIGVPREYFGKGLAPDVEQAVRAALREYEKLGATLVDISLPKTELSIPVYYVIAPAEASSNLSRFDGVRYGHRAQEYKDLADMYSKTRAEGFGEEVKRRILVGAYVLSHGYYDAYYLQAQKIRRLIAQDFQNALNGPNRQCDVIMGPVSPTVAWDLGDKADDPVANYLADIFTLSTSLAGLPGMSIPCGFGQGDKNGKRPVGLQIIGNYFDEAKLLNVAHQYQLATDWHRRTPEGL